jgi:hypothetical protein
MRAAITSAALLGLGILAALSVTRAQQSGKMKRIGIISTIPLATWRTLPGTHALLSEGDNGGWRLDVLRAQHPRYVPTSSGV